MKIYFPYALKNIRGQGLTEYIALVLLVAVISIGATKALGNTIQSKIREARHLINSGISGYDRDTKND